MNIDGTILVLNSGSSSLKFQLFEMKADIPASILRGAVRDLGDEAVCEWRYQDQQESTAIDAHDHAAAVRQVFTLLEQISDAGHSLLDTVAAIGHRIVHGGDRYFEPTLLTDDTLETLDDLSPLAPLHNPPALAVVRACRQQLPAAPMVAAFDTAFFHDLPDYVRAYALPGEWTAGPQPVRRYGFHGLAHRDMAERVAALHTGTPNRLITLQLGHGCSVAAIRDGRAIETSMGFTPLEGLIMATRPGDVDAGVVLHMLQQANISAEDLNDGLNHNAGLLGLSGVSADMQKLLQLEAQGHAGARLAVEAFCHRARKYVGAYLAVLGGADAIVFGGGIGEHAPDIRGRICSDFEWCGLQLDAEANASAAEALDSGRDVRISTTDSHPAVYVISVNEEALIARDTVQCLRTHQ